MQTRTGGIVFDVHRFALNDGPGIRTTVFLKGCFLKCEWCHNPESQDFRMQLSFNPEKCINCFECVDACPAGAHKIFKNRHIVDWEVCTAQGECVKACAYSALKMIGRSTEVDEVMNEVLKDVSYYNKTGGGITISGGEPLAQPEFTLALLKAAKDAGIKTCVDTCGLARHKSYAYILEYTDLFLFDYKATGSDLHKKLTGAGNEIVLSNLDYLYENNAKIILRCPLIPGLNDSEEELNGIINIINKYPDILKVEIMPYHTMGRDKIKYIGREYKLSSVPAASDEDKNRWRGFYNSKGIAPSYLIIN